METVDGYLERWTNAGLLDATAAAAIREFETARGRPAGHQWRVLVALILGALLLGAGVLLFVAAHWDRVSPLSRILLVLSILVLFHGLGLLVRPRFPGFATAMHAVGTISAGAAIALVGQIFNMQEHWPSAVLLWAMCAVAGWMLLRDPFQKTFTLLLLPAWIASEWMERMSPYHGSDVYLARIGLTVGAVYLTAFLFSRERMVFGILFSVGGILLPITVGMLTTGWSGGGWMPVAGFVPLADRLGALAVVVLAVCVGAFVEKRSLPPVIAAVGLSYALPWAQRMVMEDAGGQHWQHSEPNLLAFAMVAVATVILIWWGVQVRAKALVNYGMVAFSMTVVWFYFSNVMDKLGRSIGLITLGVLFLAGGWALEWTRRRLVVAMTREAA